MKNITPKEAGWMGHLKHNFFMCISCMGWEQDANYQRVAWQAKIRIS